MEQPVNMPPADELHAVRERLKQLREREGELRSLMLADASARTGNRYCVEIQVVMKRRTDWDEVRKEAPGLIESFTYPASETHVVLRGISEDGEIFNLRGCARGARAIESGGCDSG